MKTIIHGGWKTVRYQNDFSSTVEEEVATEFPLTIMLNGEEFATMICTPKDMHELVVGFLASEGIIRTYQEILSMNIDETKGFAYVEIDKPVTSLEQDHSKRFIGSCCGKSRQFYFKSDVRTTKMIKGKLSISVEQCYKLMEQLQLQSTYFHKTGGVHNAALCSIDDIFTIRTDIGRHNALDKIYGEILMKKIPLKDKLIVFSGRISSEVVLKISKIGVGILLSKSAPTDLALKLAEDLGITTVGFVRGNSMNVYTHTYRIDEII